MSNKKKPLITVLITLAVIALAAAGVWFFWLKDYLAVSGASPVYVNPVSTIIGLNTGSTPRYSGIVEPQETYKVNKDDNKALDQVFVDVGDEVHPGDALFRYSTEQLQIDLKQAQIDLEGISNQIASLKAQITTLTAEKKAAPEDEQLGYTIRIQQLELQIDQLENNSAGKTNEIERLRQSISNTDVFCEVDGIIKEVNTVPKTDASGQPAAFITILSSGEYRIKGTISELNLSSIYVGQEVTVLSRLDPEQTWSGFVDSIDQEPTSNNNGYYFGFESGEKSSKYNFYVAMSELEGLILGQHVYIEPRQSQTAPKSGLWLPAVYVDHDESGSFVWARGDRDKLEKRLVTLGDFDAENDLYEIRSGVNRMDYIAYPSEALKPGMPTTTDTSYLEIDNGQGGYVPGRPSAGSNSSNSAGSFVGGDQFAVPDIGNGGVVPQDFGTLDDGEGFAE